MLSLLWFPKVILYLILNILQLLNEQSTSIHFSERLILHTVMERRFYHKGLRAQSRGQPVPIHHRAQSQTQLHPHLHTTDNYTTTHVVGLGEDAGVPRGQGQTLLKRTKQAVESPIL